MQLLSATTVILAAIATIGMVHANPAQPAASQQLTKRGFRSVAVKAGAAGAGWYLAKKGIEAYRKSRATKK
ncbi:hypothetical protein H4R33_003207 [Dimargaris cristalligena]|nr:hypothetical protein H4R33_003207 [Dimargaris cristalligena]